MRMGQRSRRLSLYILLQHDHQAMHTLIHSRCKQQAMDSHVEQAVKEGRQVVGIKVESAALHAHPADQSPDPTIPHLTGLDASLVPQAERSVAPNVQDEGARDDQVDGNRHLYYFTQQKPAARDRQRASRAEPASPPRLRVRGASAKVFGCMWDERHTFPVILLFFIHSSVARLLQYGLSPYEDVCLAPSHRRFYKI